MPAISGVAAPKLHFSPRELQRPLSDPRVSLIKLFFDGC